MVHKKKLIIGLAVPVLLLLAGIVLLITWRMAAASPADYRPEQVSPEQIDHLRQQTDMQAENLYNQIQQMDPFIFRLSAQQVNRILMMDHNQINDLFMLGLKKEQWLHSQDYVRAPQIRLDAQRLDLLARVSFEEHSGIATVRLACDLNEEQAIRLRLNGFMLGRLPLPRNAILEQIRQAVPEIPDPPRDTRFRSSQKWIDRFVINGRKYLQAFLAGEEIIIDPVFPVDDVRQIRVIGLSCDDGQLELLLQPEPLAAISE